MGGGDPENPTDGGGGTLIGDKPQDFQIRLKIVQAHQLSGSNISPFCRVSFAGTSRQTRVQSSTTSPEWDESIIINARNSPAELATMNIEFEVIDSRGTFASNVVIGSFSLQASQVYSEPKHGLLNRWLFLTDPQDGSTHTGYLRVSAAILGPGDPAPTFPTLAELGSDDDDIEKRLLKSSKAATTPAELVCRMYGAEDLPQMDPSEMLESMKKFFGSKPKEVDRVDPYALIKFAGKTARTDARETNMSPKWNQELIIPIQLPCVSDRLTVILRDWDRLGDDETIGTFSVSLRDITLNGEGGFAATFGPTWVNFYGSNREYALTNPLKDLDEGKGEGVAFRGRAFFQFFVRQLAPAPDSGVGSGEGEAPNEEPRVMIMNHEDIVKTDAFNKRRKFRLLAVVYDAGWLPSKDGPVEIEASIGLFGDKIDKHASPSGSTTAPAMPRFDGSAYYFLPHLSSANYKTCLMVEAPFEDSAFRLETINYFANAATILTRGLDRYEGNSSDSDALKKGALKQIVRQLKDFITTYPLPKAKQDPTELDNHLNKHRSLVLEEMQKDLDRVDKALDAYKVTEKSDDDDECFENTVKELRNMRKHLEKLGVEWQNSFPDVFIWVLRDMKRFAYARIPAASIFFSKSAAYNGSLAGKLQTIELKYPSLPDNTDKSLWSLPGVIRARFWFCTDNRFDEWYRLWPKSSVEFYAQIYENQMKPKLSPGWMAAKAGSDKRPGFSDESGELDVGNRNEMQPPPGWCWEDDWTVASDLINLYQTDDGTAQTKIAVKDKSAIDEVFEINKRASDASWVKNNDKPYISAAGLVVPPPNDNQAPPAGWVWEKPAVWKVDTHRACDDEGWDYGESLNGPWEPVDKWYLTVRRRRWIRKRVRVTEPTLPPVKKEEQKLGNDGWVYAPTFTSSSISPKERSLDWTRWRLWRRRIIPKGGTIRAAVVGSPPKPKQPPGCFVAKSSVDGGQILLPPKAYIKMTETHEFQLRAYIFEARDLLPANQDGFSDPFVLVSCSTVSSQTEAIEHNLCPRWDQTIILDGIPAAGPIAEVSNSPPPVVIEFFSQNSLSANEFLGRCRVFPTIRLSPDDNFPPVRLEWIKIDHPTGAPAGELLAAFELIRVVPEKDLPIYPPMRGHVHQVPSGIRPVLGRTAVEVMCWGVRNMRRYQLVSVNSPSIAVELNASTKETPVIRDLSSQPNFPKPGIFFDLALPVEPDYTPPLNLQVFDNRRFGRKPLVGTCSIGDIRKFTRKAIEKRWFSDPRTMIKFLRRFSSAVYLREEIGTLKRPKKRSDRQSPVVAAEAALSSGVDRLKLMEHDASAQSIQDDTSSSSTQNDKQPKGPIDISSTTVNTADIDFWSRYYASIPGCEEMAGVYADLDLDKFVLCPAELEKTPIFQGFSDFCDSFTIKRGRKFEAKKEGADDDSDDDTAGELKAAICVYSLPDSPTEPAPEVFFADSILPSTAPVDCVIRLYLLEAIDLQPTDANGLADPFVEIEVGSKTMNNRSEYVPNTLNPIFGKLFEFRAKIPVEKDLHLRVRDYDLIGGDDIIGETVIDLENRMMTLHRATVGLPETYLDSQAVVSEENPEAPASIPLVWRDSEKPSDILRAVCERRRMGTLVFPDSDTIKIGEREFKKSYFPKRPQNPFVASKKKKKDKKNGGGDTVTQAMLTGGGGVDEQFCLDVLNLFELVPEHIEQRPLYSDTQPGVEQGRVRMWLDIFPGPPAVLPTPRDIRPRKPVPLELRCIIWNTKDVILADTSLTGEKMVDIYVKAWLKGMEEDIQETDVHYRSMDGEGNFNWRFIFNFNYLTAERRIVVKKKEHFWSVDETEMKFAPVLVVQVWDNDQFSADDFLGQIELPLPGIPKPAKDSDQCKLTMLPEFGGIKASPLVNLFSQKRLKGFWPVFGDETGTGPELTGKVEMEMELLSEDDSKERPAARAREEPNANPHLEPPKRPESSFMAFANPLKMFNFAIWRKFKYHFMIGLFIFLLILLLLLAIYSFPGALVNRIVNPNR